MQLQAPVIVKALFEANCTFQWLENEWCPSFASHT